MDDDLTDLQVREMYRETRKALLDTERKAETISRGAGGIKSETAQHFWASVLFTRLVVTFKSISLLTPELKPSAHFDFSAVASLTRNLAECYLFFYFLCVDDIPQTEKDARIIMLNLHDDGSRSRMLGELEDTKPVEDFEIKRQIVRDDLKAKFEANDYLSKLPEKRQREILKGEKTPFVQDEVIERTKLDKNKFRFVYRFFSNHTHTGPVSFYRMTEHDRGYGFPNRLDEGYMTLAMSFASEVVGFAMDDMLTLFPHAEERGRKMRSAQLRGRGKNR